MVASSRGPERPNALRRLNAPRPLQVRIGGAGAPAAVRQLGVWRAVIEVLDQYRTDDRWWTSEPISRAYYGLLLEDGRTITLFRDELSDSWYEQRYG